MLSTLLISVTNTSFKANNHYMSDVLPPTPQLWVLEPFAKDPLPDSCTASGLKTRHAFKTQLQAGAQSRGPSPKACPLLALGSGSLPGEMLSPKFGKTDDFLLQDLGWGATGTWWVEAKGVAQILQFTGQPSQQRIIESSVSSVEVGKAWPGDSV